MKFRFTKLMLLTAAMGLSVSNANAIIYTAHTSGNFSSAATWSPGVPPISVGANDIVINSGVTVTLDRNLEFANTNSLLQLNGSAKIVAATSGSYSIAFKNGFLTGTDPTCEIDVDSLYISGLPPANVSFAGTMKADVVALAAAAVVYKVEVNERLRFLSGTTNLNLGSLTLNASTTPTIYFEGGILNSLGGTLSLNPHHVCYKDASLSVSNSNWEISSNTQNVEFDLGTGTISLSGNLTIPRAKLMLTSGDVDIDGRVLEISGTGAIDPSGTGTIKASAGADINVTSSEMNLGTLRLHFSDHTVDNFTLNGSAGAELKIGSDMIVGTMLNLQGGMLNIQGNKLTISSSLGGSISGGSANSYVITEANGELVNSIPTNSTVLYPVGTADGYAGANISAKGAAFTDFGVNVVAGVMAHVTSGADLATSEPLVNAMWTTSYNVTTGLDYDIELMWEAGHEVNSFNRSKCYVTAYQTSDKYWESSSSSAAISSGGTHAQKKTGATMTGSYAVFDENTTGINDVVNSNTINVFPNPAHNLLNVELNSNAQDVAANVYNTVGQTVITTNLNQGINTIFVGDLPVGVYYLQINGTNMDGTTKFVVR